MPEKNLFETSVDSLSRDDQRMRAWMALVGCFTSVERSLRRRFNSTFKSSLPRYDVLTALAQFPDGLTMGELASKLMVSKGNITGVVRRLQDHQYVHQSTSSEDRRVQLVRLTTEGRGLWENMHSAYCTEVDEVLSGLSTTQCRALAEKLTVAQERIDEVLDGDTG